MSFKVRKIRHHFKNYQKKKAELEQKAEKAAKKKEQALYQFESEHSQPEKPSNSASKATHHTKSPENLLKQEKLLKQGTFIGSIIMLLILVFFSFQIVKSINLNSLIFSFGQSLQTTKPSQTNFLLVGVGGEGHDGSNLTDTIILANLNTEQNHVKMVSIPRDFFVEDEELGDSRINKIYDTYIVKFQNPKLALEKLKSKVSQITGEEIQYVIKIDFNGFIKIIDSLGGVTVNVENAIYDPYYPLGETTLYTTFSLPAGEQTLDGETALKYARSRKTTSDFDRSRRQQQLMLAIKEKALSLDILTNPTKLQSLYNSLASSLDTNLNLGEIIELARISEKITKADIENRVLNDDPATCGGFLYTPSRELYGGAAVLVSIGEKNQTLIKFISNFFNSTPITFKEEIQVLNATKVPGLAGKYLDLLNRECLNPVYYANAENRDQENSVIYYQPGPEGQLPASLALIKQIIDAPTQAGIPPQYLQDEKRANTSVVIEIGKDYKSIAIDDPFDKIVPIAPTIPAEAAPETPLNSKPTT